MMHYIKKLNHYIINDDTMAMRNFSDPVYKTWIYERETEYLCQQKPEEILDESCKRKGISTLDGRKKAVADLLQKKTRLPIPIETNTRSIFIPTTMRQRESADWFSYQYALGIKPSSRGDFYNTVILKNRKQVDLEITKSIYDKQIMYASYLIGYFTKRDDIY